jgi:hypothetical protein
LLEEGPAIGFGSLRFSHQTVSWENAGTAKVRTPSIAKMALPAIIGPEWSATGPA